MQRRTFIKTVSSLFIAPLLAPGLLFAATSLDYSPGLIKKELAAGKTVFVDYAATWCGTCKRQARIINELRENNPEYDKKIIFVTVDWDEFGTAEVTTSRNIPRRSTLLVLRGDKELGRIVAGTNKNEIKALLDSGL